MSMLFQKFPRLQVYVFTNHGLGMDAKSFDTEEEMSKYFDSVKLGGKGNVVIVLAYRNGILWKKKEKKH